MPRSRRRPARSRPTASSTIRAAPPTIRRRWRCSTTFSSPQDSSDLMSFTQREARRIIRKAVGRVPEGEEIRHLNIMPMMDMMTILLVAFVYQAAVSATQLSAGTVSLPRSLSDDELPEGATTLIITKTGITVSADKAKPIVGVSNGDVDPSDKEGQTGRKIPALTNYLGALRHEEDAVRA